MRGSIEVDTFHESEWEGLCVQYRLGWLVTAGESPTFRESPGRLVSDGDPGRVELVQGPAVLGATVLVDGDWYDYPQNRAGTYELTRAVCRLIERHGESDLSDAAVEAAAEKYGGW